MIKVWGLKSRFSDSDDKNAGAENARKPHKKSTQSEEEAFDVGIAVTTFITTTTTPPVAEGGD